MAGMSAFRRASLVFILAALLLDCGSSSPTSTDGPPHPTDAAGGADHPAAMADASPGGHDGAAIPDTAAALDQTVQADSAPVADGPATDVPPPDAAEADANPSAGGLCATRSGGALVTFGICSPAQTLTVWITSGAFIDEAKTKKGMKARIPVFDLLDGRDCDPAWSWHVDATTAQFADATTEVCDGCPKLVESGKADWLKLGRYCPWSASVVDVVDRR